MLDLPVSTAGETSAAQHWYRQTKQIKSRGVIITTTSGEASLLPALWSHLLKGLCEKTYSAMGYTEFCVLYSTPVSLESELYIT